MIDEDEDDEIREGKILNPPDVIWLNVGELDWQDVEFSELDEVSWCADKVYEADVRYILATPLTKAAPDLLEALQAICNDGIHCAILPILEEKARAAIEKATGGRGMTSTVRLPYDYARCTSRDADDAVCPQRDTCKRYLAPGREHWQSWVLSKWDGEKCEMRIPTDD